MRGLKHSLIWTVLAAGLLLASVSLWHVYVIQRQNGWLHQLQAGKDIDIELVMTAAPEIRLARAAYLHDKQRFSEALDTLSLIVEHGDSQFQAQSRYNLGNVYLGQALVEIEAERINQALPLLALAKQAYRQALRLDNQFWDAKYNLELAMRLLPEFDRISQNEADEDAAAPSQHWTTLPGFPRGLP